MTRFLESEARAQLLSDILNTFGTNHWADPDDFSVKLASEIMSRRATSKNEIRACVDSISTIFFRVNRVTKTEVTKALVERVGERLESYVSAARLEKITLSEVFPEIAKISDRAAQARLADFQGPEKKLQDSLREIFRRKGATLAQRTRDSAKEVADIEHFVLKINGIKTSFAVVVKGMKSTSKKKLAWENLAHQITKARRANPDHMLVFSAKEPVDELITSIEEYNLDIGRPGCVVFVPPLDLSRILIANGF